MPEKQDSIFKKIAQKVTLIYTGLTFFFVFLLLFPAFVVLNLLKKKRTGLVLTRHWAAMFYFLMGMRIVIENKHFLDKKSTYIFCPNHFSFFDITTMTQMPVPFKFVGKESLSKVPFFGYYFTKFHITVNRENRRSSYQAFKDSIETLNDGLSLTVFPEGGINVANTTQLSDFKEGPFRMALKTGVPLVPVTIADNWRIFPDDGKNIVTWKRKSRVIIHEPIDPSNYDQDSLKVFQDDVRKIIQSELDARNA